MRLNSDDRKKRRKKQKIAKFGLCPRYPNAKVRYENRAVAEFDRNVLQATNPQFIFEAFKCNRGGGGGCGRWHVGRKMTNGEFEIFDLDGDAK